MTDAPADLVVRGDDAALATAIAAARPDSLIRFLPSGSDFARSIGLADAAIDDTTEPDTTEPRGIALPVDVIRTGTDLAVNVVVLGIDPTRLAARHRRRGVRVVTDGNEIFVGAATTVVIANGQFIEGADLVPRGHPGDGWCEVQIYALAPAERRAMRHRLPSGAHLPHPRIITARARTVEITTTGQGWPLTLDGHAAGPRSQLQTALIPNACRLLV